MSKDTNQKNKMVNKIINNNEISKIKNNNEISKKLIK